MKISVIEKTQKKITYRLELAWNLLCRAISRNSHCSTERLGSEYGGWTFCPDVLGENIVVYSAGIGEDITFDLELIEKYHCNVFAFDPTPRSIEWLRQQDLPEQFKWYQFGISDYDGDASFFPPEDKIFVSHTILNTQSMGREPINVQVKRIRTILDMLDHKQIDILKMDIEGAEYATLNDLLTENLDIKQILVEFHHFFPDVKLRQTIQAVVNLYFHGYKLTSISLTGHEYSFLRR